MRLSSKKSAKRTDREQKGAPSCRGEETRISIIRETTKGKGKVTSISREREGGFYGSLEAQISQFRTRKKGKKACDDSSWERPFARKGKRKCS